LARAHYQQVLSDKTHYLALESQYGVGETHFAERQFQDAVKAYMLTLLYKDGEKWQAASLFRISQCYQSLDNNDKAIKYLKRVIAEYPKSEEAKLAAEELQKLE